MEDKEKQRQELEKQIQEFLKKGGVIQKIPEGETGELTYKKGPKAWGGKKKKKEK